MHNKVYNEIRVNFGIGQMLKIARRYDNPEYLPDADRKSDVHHGSIFVYEILKNGVGIDKLRELLSPNRRDLSAEASSVLDEIVEQGISDLLRFCEPEFITK